MSFYKTKKISRESSPDGRHRCRKDPTDALSPESGNSYKLALMLTLRGQASSRVDRLRRRHRRERRRGGKVSTRSANPGAQEADGERLTHTGADPGRARRTVRPFAVRPPKRNSRCCAGCPETTTSSPASWRPITSPDVGTPPSPDPHVLAFRRKRLDDFLGILERHLQRHGICDLGPADRGGSSMIAYLSYPGDETGYDLALNVSGSERLARPGR